MKVLLGLAGGQESRLALEETVRRAAVAGDDLTVAILDKDEMERTQEAVATEAREVAAEHDLEVEVRIVSGHPGSTLVETAERESFDELVIGGGTESPMGKIRLGPVTEFVLLNATMTVRLVR